MKEMNSQLDAENKEKEPQKPLYNYAFPFLYCTKNTGMVEACSHYYTRTTYNLAIATTTSLR